MKVKTIYSKCLKDIGGQNNEDVIWYSSKRPKTITRISFFEAAVFAVWVSGLKRKSVNSFLDRAEDNGFNWDFGKISNQTPRQWKDFKVRLHGKNIPERAEKKWDAIRFIAKELNKYKNDNQFRKEWFDGKSRSSGLNNENVKSLKQRKLPFIGPANSHFIIRNMGGEAIKCDRWLVAFMNYLQITESQLLKALKKANIPAGLFDLAIWAYCEKFVWKISKFDNHFKVVFNQE